MATHNVLQREEKIELLRSPRNLTTARMYIKQ